MRVILTKTNSKKLFNAALLKKHGLKKLAIHLNFSARTIIDWRNSKYSIPINIFENLKTDLNLSDKELEPQFLPDFWHIQNAAKKGALARMKLYGTIGTPEGRKRGGLASLATHYKMKSGFKILKKITKPKHSKLLAEFMGILFGDGHLSNYQIIITTNSRTDRKHAFFVQQLMKKLFHTSITIKSRKNENTMTIISSSKALVNFLNQQNMPIGNKIKHGLSMPKWIKNNTTYQQAFLRGLFDTDGCIYLDKHKRGKRIYKHLGWTITSYADTLVKDIIIILQNNGFSPTHRSVQKSVYLRRQNEILRYFSKIGTSNPKHLEQFRQFSGRVPKWS